MPTYTVTTNFYPKDDNDGILGTEIQAEFDAIEAALALTVSVPPGKTLFDTNGGTISGALVRSLMTFGNVGQPDTTANAAGAWYFADTNGAQTAQWAVAFPAGGLIPVLARPAAVGTPLVLSMSSSYYGRALGGGTVEDFLEGLNNQNTDIGGVPWVDVLRVGSVVYVISAEETFTQANGDMDITWEAA